MKKRLKKAFFSFLTLQRLIAVDITIKTGLPVTLYNLPHKKKKFLSRFFARTDVSCNFITTMKEVFKYKYDELFNPTLTVLHNLGGSGSVSEIEEQVASILKLTDEQVNEIHRGNTRNYFRFS